MTPRHQTLLAAVLAGVLAAVMGLSFLAHSDFHNPFDENSHYDYVVRIAETGSIPPRTTTVGQRALQDWACSGAAGFERLDCSVAIQDPASAPWEGANTATRYFPTYYVLTAIPTRLVHTVTSTSWLDAARIATTGWLILLAVGIVLVTRRLGASAMAALSTAVLVSAMPMVVVQGTSINNDVAGAALGLLAVWAWLALRAKAAHTRLLVSGGLALLAMTTKENALVAVVAIAGLEWAHQYRAETSSVGSVWRSLRWPAVCAGAVGAGYLLLVYVLDPLLRGPSPRQAEELVAAAVAAAEPQQWGDATAKAYTYLLSGFQAAGFMPVFTSAWSQLIPVLITMLLVGATGYRVMRTSWPWVSTEPDVISQTVLAYLVAFPLLFFALMELSGLPLVFQPRYYLPGLVLAACVLFLGLSRAWVIATLLMTMGLYGWMLAQVLSA